MDFIKLLQPTLTPTACPSRVCTGLVVRMEGVEAHHGEDSLCCLLCWLVKTNSYVDNLRPGVSSFPPFSTTDILPDYLGCDFFDPKPYRLVWADDPSFVALSPPRCQPYFLQKFAKSRKICHMNSDVKKKFFIDRAASPICDPTFS